MKKLFLLLVLLCGGTSAYSQMTDTEDVYSSDFTEPKFQGGDVTAFHKYVRVNFNSKKVAKPGKMVASFTIDAEGQLKDIRIVELVDAESAQEFIRVLKASPRWEPARRGGKAVEMTIKLPLEIR